MTWHSYILTRTKHYPHYRKPTLSHHNHERFQRSSTLEHKNNHTTTPFGRASLSHLLILRPEHVPIISTIIVHCAKINASLPCRLDPRRTPYTCTQNDCPTSTGRDSSSSISSLPQNPSPPVPSRDYHRHLHSAAVLWLKCSCRFQPASAPT